jgi:hypothetical protein
MAGLTWVEAFGGWYYTPPTISGWGSAGWVFDGNCGNCLNYDFPGEVSVDLSGVVDLRAIPYSVLNGVWSIPFVACFTFSTFDDGPVNTPALWWKTFPGAGPSSTDLTVIVQVEWFRLGSYETVWGRNIYIRFGLYTEGVGLRPVYVSFLLSQSSDTDGVTAPFDCANFAAMNIPVDSAPFGSAPVALLSA